jgi:hypothetical protein
MKVLFKLQLITLFFITCSTFISCEHKDDDNNVSNDLKLLYGKWTSESIVGEHKEIIGCRYNQDGTYSESYQLYTNGVLEQNDAETVSGKFYFDEQQSIISYKPYDTNAEIYEEKIVSISSNRMVTKIISVNGVIKTNEEEMIWLKY